MTLPEQFVNRYRGGAEPFLDQAERGFCRSFNWFRDVVGHLRKGCGAIGDGVDSAPGTGKSLRDIGGTLHQSGPLADQ